MDARAPGGLYLDPQGKYHDANGNFISKEDAEARIAEYDRLREKAGEPTLTEQLEQREAQITDEENARRNTREPLAPAKQDLTINEPKARTRRLSQNAQDAAAASGGLGTPADTTASPGADSEVGGGTGTAAGPTGGAAGGTAGGNTSGT